MPYSNPTIRINKDMKYKYQYKIDVGKLLIPIPPPSVITSDNIEKSNSPLI